MSKTAERTPALPPHIAALPAATAAVAALTESGRSVLTLPFDVARAQYANAVRVGLIESSIIKTANTGRWFAALEQLCLGPWARRV